MPAPGGAKSRNALERIGLTPKGAITVITTLAALIGAIKTLTAETTGSSLPAGHLLFYIGGSAFALYVACAAGAIFGGGAVMFVASVFNAEESEAATYLAITAGLIVAVLMMFALTGAGVLWDYEGSQQSGRIMMSLIGLAVLGLPVYLYARGRKDEAS